ncbi:MAG TPA: SDR family NAD(P)-dependent oxidoreductase [Candidatus Sulfotelmatobacter sp.]|nr:SDR family NAD(P)-dependent oxidoreductase [Candidatus Sulfotelmatobacter sp.]
MSHGEPERQPACVIAGAGPHLGLAIAAQFAAQGFAVYILSRSPARLETRLEALRAGGFAVEAAHCDVTDSRSVDVALGRVRRCHGHCDVLIYNAFAASPKNALELDAQTLSDDVRVSVGGALTLVHQTVAGMRAAGGGTVLFTGCLEPAAEENTSPSGAIGKAGLHALAEYLMRELEPDGIRVGVVSVSAEIHTAAGYAGRAAECFWDMFVTSERNYEPHVRVVGC